MRQLFKAIPNTAADALPMFAEFIAGIIVSREQPKARRGYCLIKIKSMHCRVSIVAREDEVLPVSESLNDSINID